MFSCRTFPKTKQRSLDFQPPLISDKCGAFRDCLGSGGFRDLVLGWSHCLEQKTSDLWDEAEGFLSHFWGKHCLKKDLVCTGCPAALVGSR